MANVSFGVITEQGDLGLGFDVLNENDNNVVNESKKEKKNNSDDEE